MAVPVLPIAGLAVVFAGALWSRSRARHRSGVVTFLPSAALVAVAAGVLATSPASCPQPLSFAAAVEAHPGPSAVVRPGRVEVTVETAADGARTVRVRMAGWAPRSSVVLSVCPSKAVPLGTWPAPAINASMGARCFRPTGARDVSTSATGTVDLRFAFPTFFLGTDCGERQACAVVVASGEPTFWLGYLP